MKYYNDTQHNRFVAVIQVSMCQLAQLLKNWRIQPKTGN